MGILGKIGEYFEDKFDDREKAIKFGLEQGYDSNQLRKPAIIGALLKELKAQKPQEKPENQEDKISIPSSKTRRILKK